MNGLPIQPPRMMGFISTPEEKIKQLKPPMNISWFNDFILAPSVAQFSGVYGVAAS